MKYENLAQADIQLDKVKEAFAAENGELQFRDHPNHDVVVVNPANDKHHEVLTTSKSWVADLEDVPVILRLLADDDAAEDEDGEEDGGEEKAPEPAKKGGIFKKKG